MASNAGAGRGHSQDFRAARSWDDPGAACRGGFSAVGRESRGDPDRTTMTRAKPRVETEPTAKEVRRSSSERRRMILDTIFEERWTGFIATIRAIREDDRAAEEKLVAIAELILRDHGARPEWIKVLIFEIQRTRRFADPDRMRRTEELFEHVAGLLRAGQRRGELRGDLQPDLAARIFIGGLDILVTSRALALIEVEGDRDASTVGMARTMVELFMRGMAA